MSKAAIKCAASVPGTEYGPGSHMPHPCGRPAKREVTMHRYGDSDVTAPACGVHARVAETTGRVYVA